MKVNVMVAMLVLVIFSTSGLAQVTGGVKSEGNDSPVPASVPRSMTYQGVLKDGEGEPIPDSFFDITFRVFNVPNGGTQLWSQVIGINTDAEGIFSAQLTNVNIPFNEDYWLELVIGGEILDPRQKLNMVGYAAVADTANYAENVLGGSSRWSVSDSVLYTKSLWGIARGGAGNHVYGTSPQTMVNLGCNSTTGTNGQSWGYATVGGGSYNMATKSWSTVAGGYANQASEGAATASGGEGNIASGIYSTIGGGYYNEASGAYTSIPGGNHNQALGSGSLTAGFKAKANYIGTFVWADWNNEYFESTAPNQFLIRAAGGVGIGTNDPTTQLDVEGTIKSRSGGFEFPDGTTQTTASIALPIGAVIAWHSSMPNTPPLPPQYVECNGQVLSDPESPYNGQTIPNLNGGNRFLRGSTTSGSTGGASTHSHSVDVDDWAIVNVVAPTQFVAVNGTYPTNSVSNIPPYYTVVWVMRIK